MFTKDLEVRRNVLDEDYVDASLARADDFVMAFRRITTEYCWGYAWTREGLDRRTRSLMKLAMLTALGIRNELRLQRGADQRCDSRRDQRSAAARNRLLRHCRRAGRVQSGARCSAKGRRASGSNYRAETRPSGVNATEPPRTPQLA